ncbi:NAD(P)H-dependent oxidoreductase [Phreatobacter sp.]|uniref:NAD(P)H-dependent oxidoreductase n=1 Tax=Phreatobacter sp. TaxID=1966341 RepID=UPI003F72894B
MRILLVYCHPCPESFTAAIRDRAVAALAGAGHTVEVVDLHAEGFNPVMEAAERRDYHTPGLNEQPVAAHLAALRRAEGLLFVYPTWWYGLPAMLKGWLDRVWVPHATFTMPEDGRPIGRVLTDIRLVAAVSTLGSPWWWWRFVMSEPGRRTLLRGLRPLVHPRCRTLWLALHEIDTASAGQREAFLEKVGNRLGRVR